MRFLLPLLLFAWMSVWGAEIQIPVLNSPVMDEAGLLNEAERESLRQLIYEIHTRKGPQITVLTVPDLQGYVIEDFSIRVVEKWQLGSKEADNGLLILISKNDRKMRIEVGQGLEGDITDYEAHKYISTVLTPYFKEQRFHDGLQVVILDMAQKFNIQLQDGNRFVKRAAPPHTRALPNLSIFLIPMILILGILHLIFRTRPVLRGVASGVSTGIGGFLLLGIGVVPILILALLGFVFGLIGLNNVLYALAASGGRGGYGGGGGGGSSWGGGGGGFSGGGSSGSW